MGINFSKHGPEGLAFQPSNDQRSQPSVGETPAIAIAHRITGHAPPGAHSICRSLPGAGRAVEPGRENIDWCGGFKPRRDAEARGTRRNADGEPNPAHAENRAERPAS